MVGLDEIALTTSADFGFSVCDRTANHLNRRRVMSLFVVALLLLPVTAVGQSLAEIAAREKERRKKVSTPARTITERDLAVGRPVEVPSTPAAASAAMAAAVPAVEAAEEPETPSEDEEREDRLEAWRQMLENARDDVARFSAEVDRLEASLGDLSGLYGSGRTERISQLEKAKQGLAASRQLVEQLEDVGRRHGYR